MDVEKYKISYKQLNRQELTILLQSAYEFFNMKFELIAMLLLSV